MGVFSDSPSNQMQDSEANRYLIFSLGEEKYGVEIKAVSEIIGMHPITKIPKMPDFIRGVINLRGKTIPVIDVRIRFGKQPKDYSDRTTIVVVHMNEMQVGLIVDSAHDIMHIDDEFLLPPPDFKTGFLNRFINKIGMLDENMYLLIDCDKLLRNEDIESIKTINQWEMS